MRGLDAPGLQILKDADVNVEGIAAVFWQPVWDYQTYAAAGFTGPAQFFAVPGGTAGKTVEDTNLTQAGIIPNPDNMLVTGFEMVFFPGRVPGFTAAAVPAVTDFALNDIYAVHNGRMSALFTIGDQPWLREAPLGVFASQFYLEGMAASHFTQAVAGNQNVLVDYASFRGPMYQVIPLRLISNQPFSFTVNSPAAIALPSGVNARWGVRQHGYRYRLAT